MVRFLFIIAVLFSSSSLLEAQVTVTQYFDKVSSSFSQLTDYSAEWSMTVANNTSKAEAFFKSPNKVLLKFSQPRGRYFLTNDTELTIYNKLNNTIYTQKLENPRSITPGARTLDLLKYSYNIRYKYPTGSAPRSIKGLREPVVVLIFTPINSSFGLSDLEISFSAEDDLIRSIDGNWFGAEVHYRMSNVRINTGLSDNLFIVEAPKAAKEYPNFLEG